MNKEIFETENISLLQLKICLQCISSFFKHLNFDQKGEIEYSLTYYYQDTFKYNNIDEIVSEIKRCLKYQVEKYEDIDILAEIVIRKNIIISGNEIRLFYHGYLVFYHHSNVIRWSGYDQLQKLETRLSESFQAVHVLELYEHFQTAIYDEIKKQMT